jgi:hypothetical protein
VKSLDQALNHVLDRLLGRPEFGPKLLDQGVLDLEAVQGVRAGAALGEVLTQVFPLGGG